MLKKRKFVSCLSALLVFAYVLILPLTNFGTVEANSVWPRPVIVPVPDYVSGVETPKVLLNGIWKFTTDVPVNFWQNGVDPSAWSDAKVPGDLVVQGLVDYNGSKGVEYPYKKSVMIPSDFSGKKILLRLEGGYDYARVWVNGNYICDHYGAFTTWDCDITNYVTPGTNAWITIGLTANDEATNAIEYRHTRGLIRDVSLLAVPKDSLTRFHYETDFDSDYNNATLKVTAAMQFNTAATATVNLSLKDPQGNSVPVSPSSIVLTASQTENVVNIPVSSPQKWDSEHPNLYQLTANVVVGGSVVETVTKNVGFRKITWSGNKVYVNGNQIKLRGVNWHQDLAKEGEVANEENDKASLDLLKKANVNFIRTAHYPQTQAVLDYCDKIGMYVESETSVFFITVQDVAVNSQSNPNFTAKYMNQFAEMIERDRSSACIIMWSLGNESQWGTNMQMEYDYVKMEDPSRPTIWSYPGNYDAGTTPQYDIYSVHYPSRDGYSYGNNPKPEFMDEYSHITTSDPEGISYDPGLRDFYGEELKYWFEPMYAAPGNLGGAIWYAQDSVFAREDRTFSPGMNNDWGIIDIWNRAKPEWWNVKKEYSPVYINGNKKTVPNPGAGNPLILSVQNRYNSTKLNEVRFDWSVAGVSGSFFGPNVAGGGNTGNITIPARNWAYGDSVNLKVYKGEEYVDEYNFSIGEPVPVFDGPKGAAPSLTSDASNIYIQGTDFNITFSKSTGLMTDATYKGTQIITGGPYLNFGRAYVGNNIALTATASTTSNNGDNPASYINDGTTTGIVSTDAPGFPQYINLNWDSGQTLGAVKLETNWAQSMGPTNWDIQVSADGSTNWSTVATSGNVEWKRNNNTSESKFVTFTPVHNVKGVRVKINDANLTWGHYAVQEVEAFGAWSLSSITDRISGNQAVINISGDYGNLPVNFLVAVDGTGLISTSYSINGTPPSDATEVGVAYNVSGSADTLTYKRNGTWSAYPLDYMSKNEGAASRTKIIGTDTWGAQPAWPWSQDEKDFISNGPEDTGDKGTVEFRSSKTNVYSASLVLSGSNNRLRMEGDGTGSVIARVNNDNTIRFNMNNQWSFKVRDWVGNVQLKKDVNVWPGYSNTINMRLTDNDNYTMRYKEGNLALGATADTTSNSGEYPASNINDGTPAPIVSQDNPVFPQYVTLNWSNGQTLNAVNLATNFAQGQGPTNWDVQVSADGTTNWMTVASSGNIAWLTNTGSESKLLSFTPVSNIKGVRIKINSANLQWGHYAVQEVEVYNNNLALTAAAGTTSNSGEYPASNINDGTSAPIVSQDNPVFPQYVTLDWNKGQVLNAVNLVTNCAQGQGPTNWDVQVSADGTANWTTVASSGNVSWLTNSGAESKTLSFVPVYNVKGVRIKINNANLTWGHYAVQEVEAYYNSNLALAATASTTSNSGEYPTGNVNDGTAAPIVSKDNPVFPQYVTLNWSSGQDFNGVNLVTNCAQGQGPTNWDVQVSPDGSTNWTTVASSGNVAWQRNIGPESKSLSFTPVKNMKGVRIKINNANLTWGHYAVQEIEVYNNNLALAATASTTSNSGEYPTSNINDGTSAPIVSLDDPVFPQYITLDWNSSKALRAVNLVTNCAQGQGPTDWDIQVMTDGSTNWTTVASSGNVTWLTNSGPESKLVSFTPVNNVKRVRIKINHANLTWRHYAVQEVEAYCD